MMLYEMAIQYNGLISDTCPNYGEKLNNQIHKIQLLLFQNELEHTSRSR